MKAKRIAALQHTVLFGGLTHGELAEVADRSIELHFRRGEMVFLCGERATGLFVVVNGMVRVFRQNEDGREQVMHMDAAGSVIGDVPVFDDGSYPASAICEADADVIFIEKNDVRGLCVKHPTLALTALRLMAAKVRKHAELVEALSLLEVGQRLAGLLIAEAESAVFPMDGPILLRLRLSNHEIASRIGSVRDVVSRAFAKLKHDGLISMEDRDLTILDLQGLKAYSTGRDAQRHPHE
jgi:CRP-like cAMP-binding protein